MQHGDRALGRSIRAGHPPPELCRGVGARREQLRRPEKRLLDQHPRVGFGEAVVHRGPRELLHQQEDVGGPRPRDGAQRVDLRFGKHQYLADGCEESGCEGHILGGCAATRAHPGHSAANGRRRVRHRPHDHLAHETLHRRRRHPRGNTDDDRIRLERRCDLLQQRRDHRRLHPDDHEPRARHRGEVRVSVDIRGETRHSLVAKRRSFCFGSIGHTDAALHRHLGRE